MSGPEAVSGTAPGRAVAALRYDGTDPQLPGGWLHEDGTPCPEYLAPADGTRWWCTEHQQYLRRPELTVPGRAAYEAFWANRPPVGGTAIAIPADWDREPPEKRAQWDAAAQAAIASVDDWFHYNQAVMSERDEARANLADEREARDALRAARDELRAQLATAEPVAITASRDSVAPELAAAMAETRQLRDLAAEILACFGPSGSGHTAPHRPDADPQVARARRAGGLT